MHLYTREKTQNRICGLAFQSGEMKRTSFSDMLTDISFEISEEVVRIKSPVFHDTENRRNSQNSGRKQNSQNFTENMIFDAKIFEIRKI